MITKATTFDQMREIESLLSEIYSEIHSKNIFSEKSIKKHAIENGYEQAVKDISQVFFISLNLYVRGSVGIFEMKEIIKICEKHKLSFFVMPPLCNDFDKNTLFLSIYK